MTYTITHGETLTMPRAYVLHSADGIHVFTGNVSRLTVARKASIVRAVMDRQGREHAEFSDADIAAVFDRNPFCRYDNVTARQTRIVNDDDPSDVRMTWSYSQDRGSGEWDTSRTTISRIA